MDDLLIKNLGGRDAIASSFGVQPSAVSNWKKRGVPWRFRFAMAERAKKMGVSLPQDFFEVPAAN